MGLAYYSKGEYEEASKYFLEAVNIQEEIRLTARGSVRREYLQLQIESYRNLARTYFKMGDYYSTLYYNDISRGKYLLEQMNVSNKNQAYDWNTYIDFIQSLDDNTMLLSYSLSDGATVQVIALDKNIKTTGIIYIDDHFVDEVFSKYGSRINRYVENPEENRLESIFKLYRILLARPIQNRVNNEATDFIGKYLYSKLINPFKDELQGITQLVIVPDGILGAIPFEVLKDDDDKYLVENYDISYTQSLVISQMIRNRKYKQIRDPLLAFGGAIYESDQNSKNIENSDTIVDRDEVLDMIRSGRDTRKAYSGMGLGSWQNLPGTLEEVNKLSAIVPKSKIITGTDVTEENVFDKSNSGELANYKVIHFATHGIVVPEIPELSAVVLSQTSNNSPQNDGYLTMSEIASLNIKADFVNLSACETGLGKIYQVKVWLV